MQRQRATRAQPCSRAETVRVRCAQTVNVDDLLLMLSAFGRRCIATQTPSGPVFQDLTVTVDITDDSCSSVVIVGSFTSPTGEAMTLTNGTTFSYTAVVENDISVRYQLYRCGTLESLPEVRPHMRI